MNLPPSFSQSWLLVCHASAAAMASAHLSPSICAQALNASAFACLRGYPFQKRVEKSRVEGISALLPTLLLRFSLNRSCLKALSSRSLASFFLRRDTSVTTALCSCNSTAFDKRIDTSADDTSAGVERVIQASSSIVPEIRSERFAIITLIASAQSPRACKLH